MKHITLVALLLAMAGPTQAVAVAAAQRPGPAPAKPEDAHRWAPALRAAVLQQCQDTLPDASICGCVTDQLERLSADTEVVTAENLQVALKRCRQV